MRISKQQKKSFLEYFTFLKSLSSLKIPVDNEYSDTGSERQKELSKSVEEINETEPRKNCYELKRNLKRGKLDEIGLYVPETIIRRYGFEEGDLISADHI
ncbi:hypothetical protein [Bacillus glycinifermentans]|uniref:SpoVT-AbrB domain-containing protein n=1 Tax=Bacillus glycinifermentans TaxID=1664069 RepID=A0ABU6H5L3_9BACI|nr:hypothetical protein [Bacillus glycinifermentans]MEC0486281.1 hypothetical protein [Bacillus glycinifermentans]